MTQWIVRDEATAGELRVPFRVFLSNGTAPDTGVSNDTVMLSSNGGAQFASAGSASAVSANAGMYYTQLSASNVSVLGTLAVWYDLGDFPQHVATVQVVAPDRDPYASFLSYNMGDSRLVQEALFSLRNRVEVGASVMTVYRTNDSTSAWTASVTTGAFPLAEVNPL